MIDFAGIHLDLTLTFGNILEMTIIAGGGALALSRFSTKFSLLHADLSGVKEDVGDMKEDIKKVNEVLAKTDDNSRRIGRIEDVVYGLARGDAFMAGHRVLPRVDGEYPTPA